MCHCGAKDNPALATLTLGAVAPALEHGDRDDLYDLSVLPLDTYKEILEMKHTLEED